MARIFLCHANEDTAQVEELYNRLRNLGFEPWMDKQDLIAGQNWRREIPLALKASALVLVCLSENIGRPGYVQREFKLAVDALQNMPEDLIHTIPVLLEPCSVPELFADLHWCPLFEPNGFDRLLVAIHYAFQQRGEPIPAPLESLLDLPTSFTNSIGMDFVLIPAGEFMMGTSRDQLDAIAGDDQAYRDWIENEAPQHQVLISEPFYLGQYPVTQAQWQAVMGTHPSTYRGAGQPVETVSWDDVQGFMQQLNEREGVSHYRLPTEAQWEYACRAGSSTRYHFGDEVARLGEYAWYGENSGDKTPPVGQKKPNDWGLYDMHGNVYEWCQDWYGPYTLKSITDPVGPNTGALRVIRGGYWDDPARVARAAYRYAYDPGYRFLSFGFRCLSSGSEPGSGASGKP